MNEIYLETSFNYEVINIESRLVVQQRTKELKQRLQRSALDIWESGQKLAEVRSHLKHGQFELWLKLEFGWSRRTAYNFINVYENFQERAKFAQINIATSALYLLASPSTPQAIRDKFIQRASTGEKVTYKDIRQAVSKKKLHPTPVATSTKPTIDSSPPQVGGCLPRIEIEVNDTVTKLKQKKLDSAAAITARSNGQSRWYLLEGQHLVFCGDTTSSQFVDRLPSAAIALGIPAREWHQDWLINKATAVIILQPSMILNAKLIEWILLTFSKPGEAVIFPSLPSGEIIALVHKLERLIYTGDAHFEQCSQAIANSGLRAERVNFL